MGLLPPLLRRYGIRPWELEQFTLRELDSLIDDMSG